MAEKRVTIKDISDELGVSYAIINRALNNKEGVSKETKLKILEIFYFLKEGYFLWIPKISFWGRNASVSS